MAACVEQSMWPRGDAVSDYNGSSSMRRIARLQSCTLVTALLFLECLFAWPLPARRFIWQLEDNVGSSGGLVRSGAKAGCCRDEDASRHRCSVHGRCDPGPRALACAHCGIKSGTIQPTCSFTVLSAKCTSIIRRLTRPRLPQPRFSRFALEDTGDRVR